MNGNSHRTLLPSAPADLPAQAAPAARFVALPRRLFGLRLLGAVPLAIAAAAATQPESAQAGTDGDWTLTGNTLPDSTKFLGTTNAQALTIKTDNATRLTVTSAGRVGVGTTAPATKLHVTTSITAVRGEATASSGTVYGLHGKSASSNGRGVYGEATASSGSTYGVYGRSASGTGSGVFGEATATSGSSAYGVHGKTASNTIGSGVFGEATASSGLASGVYGKIASSNGDGVRGEATASSGFGYGVYGISASSFGRGVVGEATHSSGTTIGVFGSANSPSGKGVYGNGSYAGVEGRGSSRGVIGSAIGDDGIGVLGVGSAGTTPFGVYGYTDSPAGPGYAGYFGGDVEVTGTLNKSAGAFKIDHPLDPANHYLAHSFVESPDMLNVYNGNVTLSADGSAVVQLPTYFAALNRDFRYQLTAIGAPAPNLHVEKEIANNRFTIAGGAAGMKVSWQVTGVRDDAYARAHPIEVEQPKPEHERGTYLTPKEHGQPEARRLHYEKIQKIMDRERELASPGREPAR